MALSSWAPIAQVYNPLKAGSIDGTECDPHDHGVIRAMKAKYKANKSVDGDPQKTVFIARLNRDTEEDTLWTAFRTFGKIKKCRLVRDIVTGFSKGYGFIEYEDEKSARAASRRGNHMIVNKAEVFVDMECERTLPGWIPRRFGGGVGGNKNSGQLRFGGKDRPFIKPILPVLSEDASQEESGNLTKASERDSNRFSRDDRFGRDGDRRRYRDDQRRYFRDRDEEYRSDRRDRRYRDRSRSRDRDRKRDNQDRDRSRDNVDKEKNRDNLERDRNRDNHYRRRDKLDGGRYRDNHDRDKRRDNQDGDRNSDMQDMNRNIDTEKSWKIPGPVYTFNAGQEGLPLNRIPSSEGPQDVAMEQMKGKNAPDFSSSRASTVNYVPDMEEGEYMENQSETSMHTIAINP